MSGELSRMNQIKVGRANDEVAACDLELAAAKLRFTASCHRADTPGIMARTEEVHSATQAWMDATASQYEILKRITYGS